MKNQEMIDQMFELFYEDWMDEKEKQILKDSFLKRLGVTEEFLYEQIEIGVKNGYSTEQQLKLIKKIFKK